MQDGHNASASFREIDEHGNALPHDPAGAPEAARKYCAEHLGATVLARVAVAEEAGELAAVQIPPKTKEREQLLEFVAGEVPKEQGRFTLVAVDGVDGSGKSTFASALAENFRKAGTPVVLIQADNFHHLRAVRYRLGRGSPLGFWLDSYDYAALLRDAIRPFMPGGTGKYKTAATDLEQDVYVDEPYKQAAPGTVVIVEGMFLHRDELNDCWDYSVFLHVPFSETAARMARRDGSPDDPKHPQMSRYVEGQRLYFLSCTPWFRAARVIDNTDWDSPRLLAADGFQS